jgi:hypothetical protein
VALFEHLKQSKRKFKAASPQVESSAAEDTEKVNHAPYVI